MSELRQHIRFCRTTDGVRIAYATFGDGPLLVYVSGWPTHLEIEWEKPFIRDFLRELADGFNLTRYDMRGAGLSDRNVSDFSLDALVLDLAAVIESVTRDPVTLLSLGDLGGPIAVGYATSHPERVSHLVLNAPYLRGADLASPEKQQAFTTYVTNFGFPAFEFIDAPGVEVEQHREVRDVVEQAATNQTIARLLQTLYAVDLEDRLDSLRAPVLVLHGRADTFVPLEVGREFASRLSDAEFVSFDGLSAAPWASSKIIVPEIHRFLREHGRPADLMGMTLREVEVLRLVAEGLSNREIAQRLTISINTVDRHVSNIYSKIGATNRAEAASLAVRNGIV